MCFSPTAIKACSNWKRLSPTHYIKRHKFSKAEKKHTRYFSDLKTFFLYFFTTSSDEYVRTIRAGGGGGWGVGSFEPHVVFVNIPLEQTLTAKD